MFCEIKRDLKPILIPDLGLSFQSDKWRCFSCFWYFKAIAHQEVEQLSVKEQNEISA